ncbi:MAG: hypothetical protein FJZ13_02500, partial [Candidatus Omnitrophica bacterium]|nr:hypothetical protein [Candidatus Omnitrophota bacterium]
MSRRICALKSTIRYFMESHIHLSFAPGSMAVREIGIYGGKVVWHIFIIYRSLTGYRSGGLCKNIYPAAEVGADGLAKRRISWF